MAKYVIVGGGLAAASAIEGIRELDREGEIEVLAAERELPYHRPPLSKGYLAGRDQLDSVRIHDAAWYRENHVRLRLGHVAKSVHIRKRSVTLESGERVRFERLLLATGSRARRLAVSGADSVGVCHLRTIADSTTIRAGLRHGARVVAVGGSFIGMEVAATARDLGAEVTVLEMGPTLFGRFADVILSGFFTKLMESRGVAVRTDVRVARFRAKDGRLAAVVTEAGDQVPADLAVVGVGAEPNVEWLASSGFAIDRGGVVVNVRLETAAPGIYAAGDIARFPDPLTRTPCRLEHWNNAYAQGKLAGRNMAGANESYTLVSTFFSDLFDLTINVFGDTDVPDTVEIRGTMDLPAPSFTALYVRSHKLTGAVTVNPLSADRSAEFARIERHLMEGTLP